jgi:hypothetical protein
MMTTTRVAALALALSLGMPANAEEKHHGAAAAGPTLQIAQAQQTTPPPKGPMQPGMGPMGAGRGMGMGMGMGQGGQMGAGPGMGMMGQGGMTGPDGMPGMMPMMGMMQGAQHIEGRLAFAKAELRISGAQETAWSNFANALRQAATKTHESMSGMTDGTTPLQLIEQHEKQLVARLEAVRVVKPALEQFYTGLDDEQKRTFARIHMIFRGVI